MMICCESLCSDRFLLASFNTKLYKSTKCFLATDVPQMWCATYVMCYLQMQCAADVMRGSVAVWSESSLDLTDWTTTQEQSCGLPFDLAVGWSDRLPTALHVKMHVSSTFWTPADQAKSSFVEGQRWIQNKFDLVKNGLWSGHGRTIITYNNL